VRPCLSIIESKLSLEKKAMNNLKLAQKCLELIRDMAEFAGASSDPDLTLRALDGLSQVLFERSGYHDDPFRADRLEQLTDLPDLLRQLGFLRESLNDGFSPN
jgi:hypothetical protein